MSWVEIARGQPYGGMPRDAILEKLEETDPVLVAMHSAPRNRPGEGLTGIPYKDYQVSEIIDRTPDPGFLEQDRPRRNPQMAREVLNLRYNGSRGSHADLPRNPDLFMGFLGDDPRGVENLPRFDKMREQMAHRARQLEVRMGQSVGHDGAPGEGPHQVAERPWTGPAIQRARTEMHEQARRRMRIFTTSKDGRSTGRNVATDEDALASMAAARGAISDGVGEQWAEYNSPGSAEVNGLARTRSDARTLETSGFANRRDPASTAGTHLWQNTESTASLPVAKYGRPHRGRSRAPGKEAVQTERSGEQQQQTLGAADDGVSAPGQSHQLLARVMSAVAQARRAEETRNSANDAGVRGTPGDGRSTEAVSGRKSGPGHTEVDVANAYYQTTADQIHGQQRYGRAAVPGGSSALAITAGASGATQQATWKAEQNHARATLATNMSQAARKSGPQMNDTSLDVVSATYEVIAAGARPSPAGGTTNERAAAHSRGRGQLPGDNLAVGGGTDTAKQQAVAQIHAAAASRGLEVANYSGSVPVEGPSMFRANIGTLAGADGGQNLTVSDAAQHMQNTVSHMGLPQYRGQTQVAGKVASDGQDYGLYVGPSDESAHTPSRRMGLKTVRYDRVADGRLGDDSFGEAASISVNA